MSTKGRVSTFTSAVLVASALTAGSLPFAGSAQAATGAAFCFVWAGGPAYAGPVTLEEWRGAWVPIRSAVTSPDGCGTFVGTPAESALRVTATHWRSDGFGTAHFCGATPRATVPGQGTAFIGTGVVERCG